MLACWEWSQPYVILLFLTAAGSIPSQKTLPVHILPWTVIISCAAEAAERDQHVGAPSPLSSSIHVWLLETTTCQTQVYPMPVVVVVAREGAVPPLFSCVYM